MSDTPIADAAEAEIDQLAAEAETEARAALLPGMLVGAILGDLEAALEAAREQIMGPGEKAGEAATIAHLATAAEALDRIRARADAEQAGPAIAPDILGKAATLLARTGRMLGDVRDATGRFGSEDGLETGPWTSVRLMPPGYEDLDPATFHRLAGQLVAR